MALVKSENTETNKHELEISVEAKVFDDACNRAYKKNVKKIAVPGFRKGKAPRKMIEQRYGEGVFYDDAIEDVYPKALSDAIEEAKLDVIAIEKLEPTEVSSQTGLTFKATCVTKPVMDIENYKGIKAEKPVKTVDDEAVNAQLEQLRERGGRLVTVEDRAAENGDTVDFDFDGYLDGEQFDGGKAEHYSLKLGSGQFIPGFEEQVVGKSAGEEFDVNVSFPEDYHVDELKGKPVVFKCKLHEIKKTELPDADDEFAKDVSEFDTLDELKADIRSKLEDQAKEAAEAAVENQITEALIENLKGEIPEVMFEQRIDGMLREFEQRLSAQGLNLDLYMQYTGLDKDALRGQFAEQAKRQVKVRLALEKIAELENLEVSDDQLNEEYQKLADEHKLEIEKVKAIINADDLRSDLIVDKAMDLVKEAAEVTEKAAEEQADAE